MYKINKINKESNRIEILKRIFAILLYIVLVPIIIFNMTLIIKSFFSPNEIPNFMGLKSFVIVSGSMEPTIHIQDTIFVKEVPEAELKVQDIISFQDGNTITTHRITKIEEKNGVKFYTTKGDNNKVEDKRKITYRQIEGKYQFKIAGYGVIIQFLKNKTVLITIIILLILLLCYKFNQRKKQEERRQKRIKYKNQNKNLLK